MFSVVEQKLLDATVAVLAGGKAMKPCDLKKACEEHTPGCTTAVPICGSVWWRAKTDRQLVRVGDQWTLPAAAAASGSPVANLGAGEAPAAAGKRRWCAPGPGDYVPESPTYAGVTSPEYGPPDVPTERHTLNPSSQAAAAGAGAGGAERPGSPPAMSKASARAIRRCIMAVEGGRACRQTAATHPRFDDTRVAVHMPLCSVHMARFYDALNNPDYEVTIAGSRCATRHKEELQCFVGDVVIAPVGAQPPPRDDCATAGTCVMASHPEPAGTLVDMLAPGGSGVDMVRVVCVQDLTLCPDCFTVGDGTVDNCEVCSNEYNNPTDDGDGGDYGCDKCDTHVDMRMLPCTMHPKWCVPLCGNHVRLDGTGCPRCDAEAEGDDE